MKLTTLAARHIKPGEVLRCEEVKGLQLIGKATGAKWFLRYWVAGRERKPKLGDYPALQIEAAREVARAYLKRIALEAADPSAERHAMRASPTMDELFAAYVRDRAGGRASTAEYERHWRNHISPRVGGVKAAAFGHADADALLRAVAEPRTRTVKLARAIGERASRRVQIGGPVAANRVRAILSGVLKYAEASTVAARPKGSNFIMAETPHNRERARRRHITSAEFARIDAALTAAAVASPRHVAAIRATLYCATRVSELLGARRSQLSGSILRLHEHKTMAHSADDRIIRLPRQVLELLAAIPDDGSGLLFGAGLDRWRIWDVWCGVREAAGCPDIQPRDLRRTFASVGKTLGLGLDGIAELLGHAGGDTRVTAGYAYLFDDAATSKVQEIADHMDAMASDRARKPAKAP